MNNTDLVVGARGESRLVLEDVSRATHRPFAGILAGLPGRAIEPALECPGIREVIEPDAIPGRGVRVFLAGFCRTAPRGAA